MELVVLVGLQGAGKSTFVAQRFAATHTVVSKDRMRSARSKTRRQARELEAALSAGASVVVDNTNATAADRAAVLEIGRRHGARAIACWFDEPPEDCLRRNRAREGDARVPDVGVFATIARLTKPTLAEGFAEIWRVRITPEGFEVTPEL